MPNDGSLDGFAKANNLSLGALRTLKATVVLLPLNTVLGKESKANLFPPATKGLLFSLKEGGQQSILYEDGRERRELILESADVIFPILLCVGNAALTVVLNILSNYLYDRFVRDKEERPSQPIQPSVRAEYVQIDEKGTVLKWRRIEGPAKDVARLVREESKAQAEQTGRKT